MRKGEKRIRKSLNKKFADVERRLDKQYEAIESGGMDLKDVGERIRELKADKQRIVDRLEALKQDRVIPLHFFTDDSIKRFQTNLRALFLGGK